MLTAKTKEVMTRLVAQRDCNLIADAIKLPDDFSASHWSSLSHLYLFHQLAPFILAIIAFVIQHFEIFR